ncbi:MAG TPA: 4-vinyl reductase [Anaerolineales bacterium]|nr:4-vinyl reductase [Anaerolineales bacterium]
MQIKDKTPGDPVASLYLVDAYMRWALLAAEEVVGKQGLTVLLRDRGLERFVDNYPPELLKISGNITLGDYAELCAGLLTFFGRAGKSMVIRCGRLTSRYAIEKQGSIYNAAAKTAAKLMPSGMQVKLVLDSMANGYNKLYAENGQELHFRVEDRGDKWAFISVECPLCAGKAADVPMCWGRIGTLKEGLFWLSGREFDVEEVECRAQGAQACVWEVTKAPKE